MKFCASALSASAASRGSGESNSTRTSRELRIGSTVSEPRKARTAAAFRLRETSAAGGSGAALSPSSAPRRKKPDHHGADGSSRAADRCRRLSCSTTRSASVRLFSSSYCVR